eukprot:TRINITY_DN2730_c0_g1_i1.p1 TRINITY_DN2730_c0_g1~~TRINITY_DN2730_c0_g1_i1.p1  ORF type:complete len:279 (+),score=59.60 TRINITY_DN2730_c0_g1_i1:151-987(+)
MNNSNNNNSNNRGRVHKVVTEVAEYRGGLDDRGHYHGLGLLKSLEGPPFYYYLGDWVHGRPNGKGILYDANIYEGDIKETDGSGINTNARGQPHGRGVLLYPHVGDRYEGEFDNGYVTGEGIYYWQNGDYQIGTFRENVSIGKGELHWPDGRIFVGQYEDDLRTGEGVISFPDGRKLTANYERDERKGAAKMEWANGDIWLGEFITHGTAWGKKIFASTSSSSTARDTLEGLFLNYELKDGGNEEQNEWMIYRRVLENGEVEEKQGLWQNEVFIERKV